MLEEQNIQDQGSSYLLIGNFSKEYKSQKTNYQLELLYY